MTVAAQTITPMTQLPALAKRSAAIAALSDAGEARDPLALWTAVAAAHEAALSDPDVAADALRRRDAAARVDVAALAADPDAAEQMTAVIAGMVDAHAGLGDVVRVGAPPMTAERRPYVCRELDLQPGAPAGFYSFSNAGKSIILQDLLISIAAGRRLWGQFSIRQGPCLMLDYEQGTAETMDRFWRLMRAEGIEHEIPIDVLSMPRVFLNSPGAEVELIRRCSGYTACLVDTYGAAMPGEDENAAQICAGLELLTRVSLRTRCTMIVAGHTGKLDLRGGEIDGRAAPKGNSNIIARCGVAYHVTGKKGAPKLVTQIKKRSLASHPLDDFYLSFSTPRIEGYTNPDWPSDPGAFAIEYRTAEQCEIARAGEPRADLDADIERVVDVVTKAGPAGVAGKGALARLCQRNASLIRAAADEALNRGRIRNAGTAGRPRYLTAEGAP